VLASELPALVSTVTVADFGCFEGEGEAGDTAANHQEVAETVSALCFIVMLHRAAAFESASARCVNLDATRTSARPVKTKVRSADLLGRLFRFAPPSRFTYPLAGNSISQFLFSCEQNHAVDAAKSRHAFFGSRPRPFLVWLLMYTGPNRVMGGGRECSSSPRLAIILTAILARSYNSVSTLGKFLDPMADKLVVMTALIMLTGMGAAAACAGLDGRGAGVSRDPGDGTARGSRPAEGADRRRRRNSANTKCRCRRFAITRAADSLHLHARGFSSAAGMFVLWLSMVVSVWSGIDYYVRVLRVLQRKPGRAAHQGAR